MRRWWTHHRHRGIKRVRSSLLAGDSFFLDDEGDPLALRLRQRTSNLITGDRVKLQVVRISYQCAASSRGVGCLEPPGQR
jgi:hypothetical protein